MYGGKSQYRKHYAQIARKLCIIGATDAQLGEWFHVSEDAIGDWKHRHPTFKAAVDAGKPIADDVVEASLFRRANGYEDVNGAHHPPDTTACIFWLKNRRPHEWRDRREHLVGGSLKIDAIEQTIVDPAPIIIEAGDIGATSHPTPLIEHQPTTSNGKGRG